MSQWIKDHKYLIITLIVIIAIAAIMIPLLSWVGPDGLERVLEDWGFGEFEPFIITIGFSELGIIGDILNGVIGILIVLGIALLVFYLIRRKKADEEKANLTQ